MKRIALVLVVLLLSVAPVRASHGPQSDPVPPLELQRMVREAEQMRAACDPLTPVLTERGVECRDITFPEH